MGAKHKPSTRSSNNKATSSKKKTQSSSKPLSPQHEDDTDDHMHGGNDRSSKDKGYDIMMARALEES